MSAEGDTRPGQALATVGYRNPPAEHRFHKGGSGNPRGRPGKSPGVAQRKANAAFVEDILMAEALRRHCQGK